MTKDKVSVIAGLGEVGSSLRTVLSKEYTIKTADLDHEDKIEKNEEVDILHICFPYQNEFEGIVNNYQRIYKPRVTVIHSTVPLGTSEAVGAYHSPVRGVHPNLIEGIKKFVKYLGCPDLKSKEAKWVQEYFSLTEIDTCAVQGQRNTEALKLWSTTYYGWNIIFEKMVHDFCQDRGLDFDIVYRHANESYNKGYHLLGKGNVNRPVLTHSEGEIGGHCVISNLDLFNSPINDFIREQNEKIKMSELPTHSDDDK